MSMEVGTIDLGLDVNQSYFNRQMRNLASGAERTTTSAFSGLGKKLGAVLGVAALVNFTKSCLDLGSDLAEVQNVVDTTFVKMSSAVNDFANTAIDNFGLSETVAKKYMGTLGTMSKSMGMTETVAYDMAEAITGLAGDVASFYNLSSDEAYTKLKSIWTGETESLKDLGIVMTQTALDQYALNNGLGKTTAKMTEQEKLMLRYQYVMDGLSAAQGDFLRTSDGWANQTRVLSLRFDQLKATLGQGFINALTPVVRMLNNIIARLQVAADTFLDFTNIIFGVNKASQGASTSVGGVLDSATDSANAATGAIKEASKQLAGFDKLNTISSSDSKGSGSGSSEVPGVSIEDMNGNGTEDAIKNSTLIKWFDTVKEKLEPTKVALEKLYDNGIKPLIDFVGTALFNFYDNFLKPVGSWVLGEGLPGLVDACTNLLKYINWDKLNGALKELWEALAPFAVAVGEGFIDFMKDCSEFVGSGIGLLLSGVSDGISAISGAVKGTDSRIIESVGTAVGKLLGALTVVAIGASLGAKLAKVGAGIGAILAKVSQYAGVFSIIAAPVLAEFFASLFSSISKVEKDALDTAIAGLNNSMDDLDAALKRAQESYTGKLNEDRQMKITVDAYFALANKEFLTSDEQGLLKTYAKLLTDNFEGLDEVIDAHTGKYKGTEEEIRNMIAAHQAYVMQVASEEAAIEVTKELLKAQVAYDDAKKAYDDAATSAYEGWKNLPDFLLDTQYSFLPSGWIVNFLGSWDKAYLDDMYEDLEEAEEKLRSAEESQKYYTEQYKHYANEFLKSTSKTATESSKDFTNFSKETTYAYKNFYEGAKLNLPKAEGRVKSAMETLELALGGYVTLAQSAKTDSNKALGGLGNTGNAKKNLGTSLGGMSLLLETHYKTVSTTVDNVKTKVSSMYSTIETKVQGSISKFNEFSKYMSNNDALFNALVNTSTPVYKAPELVPEKKKSVLEIDGHATGCYVKANTPQLAIIGDNKTKGEFVAPEDKLQALLHQAVASGSPASAEMVQLLRALVSNTSEIKNKDLVANVSSNSVFNAVRNESVNYTKRTGRPAF